jgi:NAD(P)-dependent dehydrogenase (short-subunit alcohol dehydrogenase family)
MLWPKAMWGEVSQRVTRRSLLRLTGAAAASGLLVGGIAHAGNSPPPFETQIFPNYFPRDDDLDEVDISGKFAVITGASRGIGRAVAEELVARGVSVIGTSRDPSGVPDPPTFPLLQLDITDAASVTGFFIALSSHPLFIARGKLDILINNAGRYVFGGIVPTPATTEGLQFYLQQGQIGMATLYTGHVALTNVLLPLMQTQPGYARILFTASIVAYSVGGTEPGSSYQHDYASGKRALLAYANNLRGFLSAVPGLEELKISTVNPYTIQTQLAEHPNPIYTEPIDATGVSPTNEAFNTFLLLIRQGLANGLPTEFAARGYRQLLTMNDPDPNVVIGSPDEPLASMAGTEFLNAIGLAEMEEAAVLFGCDPPGRGP